MSTAEIGAPFHERFVIRSRLGAGGMGIVYAAYDRERDETVALKTLHHRDPAALYGFKKEFRTLAGVAHPNLVSLYELIADGEQWFFTMELIDGENFINYVRPRAGKPPRSDDASWLTETLPLEDLLAPPSSSSEPGVRRRAPLPPGFDEERLRSAIGQLAVGVRALHGAGKVHRDLKPHNVLVTGEGRLVILDFGVARELAPTLSQLTAEAGLPGTLAYMAPEQAQGKDAAPASDWYAVGVMLFEGLTGDLPFTGTISRVLSDKLHKTAPSPRELVRDPPEDLLALCEDLLERDAANRPSGAGVLARLGVADAAVPDQSYLPIDAGDERLAGRQPHLQALENAFRRTLSGEPVWVYVHGTSGMGKTAIVHGFLRQLIEQSRAVVLPGRCYAQELVPYKALDGVVDSLSKYLVSLPRHDVEQLLPREIGPLAQLFPVLSRVDAVADASRAEGGTVDRLTRRRLAFGALRELLALIAEQQPLVLYIDDLQWADSDSTALLGDLLRPSEAPRLMLITTLRGDLKASESLFEGLVFEDDAAGRARRLDLPVEPLSDDDATELTEALFGGKPGLRMLISAIVREARGNPFLIEQLVGYTMASGADLGGTGLDSRITLAEMLATRIRRLPGAEPLLLTLAAAGRPIDSAVACQAAGVEDDERTLIAALQAAHLIRSSGSAREIELYHDRIREALAGRATEDQARQLHKALAATLVARGLDDPEALFIHYRSAGENDLAGEQAARAAAKASDALAFDRAAQFYHRALDLGGVDQVEELKLRLGLAESLASAGRPDDAARAFLELARRTTDIEALAYRSRAAQAYLASGDFDRGFAELRSVLEAVGVKTARARWRAVVSLLWQRLRLRLRGLEFRPRGAEEVAETDLLRIDTCDAAAVGLASADSVLAVDFQTRQLRFALDAGEPKRVARAMGLEVGFLATAGTRAGPRVARLLERTFELAREVGEPHGLGLAELHAGLVSYCRGDWKDAIEHCDQAVSIFTERCVNTMWETTFARRYSLAARLQCGALADVSRQLSGLLAEADELGNVLASASMRARLGMVWLAADDVPGCRQATERALASWTRQDFHLDHFFGLISECQADLYEGRGERAHERVIAGWSRGVSSTRRIQFAKVEGLFLRARCAVAAAGPASDHRKLRAAERDAKRLAGEGPAYARPMAEQIRAATAFVEGDAGAAERRLRRAAEGFDEVDMRLHAEAVRWRLGELIGGEEGPYWIEAAEVWMRGQEIVSPRRLVAMLAPGFGER